MRGGLDRVIGRRHHDGGRGRTWNHTGLGLILALPLVWHWAIASSVLCLSFLLSKVERTGLDSLVRAA